MDRQTEAQAHCWTSSATSSKSGQEELISRPVWHDYLNITRRPDFLSNLESHEARLQWADCMFRIVDLSRYTLRDMLEQRVNEHPQRLLFREVDNGHSQWSYQQVFSYMKKIAAVFYSAVEAAARSVVPGEFSRGRLRRPGLPDIWHSRFPD